MSCSDLLRQLNNILGVILRDQIIAKLDLVSQVLNQRPKGRDKISALQEL